MKKIELLFSNVIFLLHTCNKQLLIINNWEIIIINKKKKKENIKKLKLLKYC